MGMIQLGAPFEIILELAKISKATTFIETGTYHGSSSRWAAQHFKSVVTMELSPALYQQHHEELRALGNVEPLRGDSKILLPQVISRLGGAPAVFWLDGHWSSGETAGEEDECPLLGELEALVQRRGDIILIDDARLFLSTPPAPYRPDKWPTITEISRLLTHQAEQPFVQIIDDVIFVVPAHPELKKCLIDYGRLRAKAFQKMLGRARKRTLREKIKHRFQRIMSGSTAK
jgi:hypothetical protein